MLLELLLLLDYRLNHRVLLQKFFLADKSTIIDAIFARARKERLLINN